MKPETGVSYFANGWPHHFESDLEDILAHNCTYIVHCFSENEMVFARKIPFGMVRRTLQENGTPL